MKTHLIPIGMMAILLGTPAIAGMNRLVQERPPASEQNLLSVLHGGSAAHSDTVWFGGGGTGNGSVVRGGIWNWESASSEPPELFLDGDPVGNQFRDGWTFDDRTTKHGPSQTGAPHFNASGVYDFNYDATPQGGLRPGGFAHRATTHANNGVNDGPDPLAGAWSLWIGTNLELNPEHCGWGRTSGYGDGWSQGIGKGFSIPAGSAGSQYALTFRHRYAVESGHDTCWVEVSFDGLFWNQVGSAGDPNGLFTGGDGQNPLPSPAGGDQLVNLLTWPDNTAGTLHVRLRLAADAFLSDHSDGGNYRYAWQLDNLNLLRNGVAVPGELTDFETGYNGWQVATFEGYDFEVTQELNRPAGRIVPIWSLACPPIASCPEVCGLENNIVMFADRDECDLADGYMDSYITSPAFAIGGPSQPDLDGDEGRLLRYDIYEDGGPGTFEIVSALCPVYWPFNAMRCPFTPSAGHPGAGVAFNWSQTNALACDFYSQGFGTDCEDNFFDELWDLVPSTADSVILQVGVLSQCRYNQSCDVNDHGAPFYDNLRFGVYDPDFPLLRNDTFERYSDSFPTANGNIVTQTARTDNALMGLPYLDGIENPVRGMRGDSSTVYAGPNRAVYLRFRVNPGPCQPNLGHPFFVAFPPGQWHEALMDTARNYYLFPGDYMTCFHEQSPYEGTYWTGIPPAVERCDDILPDGLFTPGTVIHYFYETRAWHSAAVLGTFPRRADGGPVGITANFASLWLESSVLPVLDPACNGTYAHNFLIVNDYASNSAMASMLRDRLTSTLASLGLEFDVYDVVGANWTHQYDGIGRREDRQTQQPRPPHNGATQLQLEPYDCIWYTSGLATERTLTDQRTVSFFGGQPSIDQQKLGTWLSGCTSGANRLLVLDGRNWAADIDVNTTNGPSFLTNRGVDVLADNYSRDLANFDLRRCARIAGTALAPDLAGEIFGSGCPENYELDVLHTTNGGEALGFFVESLEDGNAPVYCNNDSPRPEWQAIVRRATGTGNCQRTVAMSFPFADFYPLNCEEQCRFDDYVINGPNAELVIDLFQWAEKPINPIVIGVGAGGAPAIEAALEAPRPNPAPQGPVIQYSIAARGRVRLKIYDVGGRLVRTLVDQVQEPKSSGYEVVWDGATDAGVRASSGVYFYELDSPGFAATRKLVLLE